MEISGKQQTAERCSSHDDEEHTSTVADGSLLRALCTIYA